MCENRTFVVAALNHIAFRFHTNDSKTDHFGRDVNILNFLSGVLHFKYEIVTPQDCLWGVCNEHTNHCTGLVGMVARKEADIGISTVTRTVDRAKFVDFSYPYYQDAVTFVTKAPTSLGVNNSSFATHPLQIQAWILTMCLLIAIIVSLKLVTWSWNEKNTSWDIVKITLRQGLENPIHSTSKVLFAITFLFFGTVEKLYECHLTSATSFIATAVPIDTFAQMAELIESQDYVVSAVAQSSLQHDITKSDIEYFKLFANSSKKSGYELPKTIPEGFNRVLEENYALIETKTELQLYILNMEFSLNLFHLASENLYVDHNSIAFHKSFPCTDRINKWLNLLTCFGLIQKWNDDDSRVFSKNYKDSGIEGIILNYIKLDDLKFVFYGLAIAGWGCAGTVLVMQTALRHKLAK